LGKIKLDVFYKSAKLLVNKILYKSKKEIVMKSFTQFLKEDGWHFKCLTSNGLEVWVKPPKTILIDKKRLRKENKK